MSLLQGYLAQELYNGFRGKLLRATLWRAAPDVSAGLDDRGDPNLTTIFTWACQGFVEDYSDIFRLRAEIPETDSKVNIFAKSLPAGIAPLKDDKVQMPAGQTWWQLRKVATDPATALWVCQSFRCEAPPT